MTLRERKKAKTREALAGAALDLFAAQGFDATTIDEIAAAAEVSRRTFFRYFPSKEAVLFPDRERRLELFRALINEARDGESRIESVRRGMLLLAEDHVAQRERVLLQQRIVEASPALLAYDFELDRHWENAIVDALNGAGTGRRGSGGRGGSARRGALPHARARLVAGAIMGVIRASLREWYDSHGSLDLVALGEEAFGLLRAGIASESKPTAPRRPTPRKKTTRAR